MMKVVAYLIYNNLVQGFLLFSGAEGQMNTVLLLCISMFFILCFLYSVFSSLHF